MNGFWTVEDYYKRPLFKHPGIFPFTRPQGKLSRGILPVDIDRRECALFIIILVALILVKLEGAICAGINVQLERCIRKIAHVLADGTYG